MIDTTNLNSLSVEELRAGIVLQQKEIERLRVLAAIPSPDGQEAGSIYESAPDAWEIETADSITLHASIPDWFSPELHELRPLYKHHPAPAEGQARPIMEPRPTVMTAEEAGRRTMERYDGALRQLAEIEKTEGQAAEREAFEAWFSDEWQHLEAVERDAVGYKLASAQNAWTAWQAAWRAAQQQEGRK
jgi:hypothetical protein